MICERGVREMTDKARELRREYKRAWNAANKDKVKASQQKYWENKAQKAQSESKGE